MLQVDIGLGIEVDMADDSGYLADSRPKSAEAPSTVMKMMMKKMMMMRRTMTMTMMVVMVMVMTMQ